MYTLFVLLGNRGQERWTAIASYETQEAAESMGRDYGCWIVCVNIRPIKSRIVSQKLPI